MQVPPVTAARHYISVDPGEVRFAVCAGNAVSRGNGRYTFTTTYVNCANIRDSRGIHDASVKKKKWDGLAIAHELDEALRLAGIVDLASTVCLIENQHMNADFGVKIFGAVKMFAQLRGMRGVVEVHAKDRGEFFRFVQLQDGNKAYRQRKKEAVRAVCAQIDEHPDRFSQQVREAFETATERSGLFDMADTVTPRGVCHLDCKSGRRRRRFAICDTSQIGLFLYIAHLRHTRHIIKMHRTIHSIPLRP